MQTRHLVTAIYVETLLTKLLMIAWNPLAIIDPTRNRKAFWIRVGSNLPSTATFSSALTSSNNYLDGSINAVISVS